MKYRLLVLPLLTIAFTSHAQTIQPTAYEFLTVVEHETRSLESGYFSGTDLVFVVMESWANSL